MEIDLGPIINPITKKTIPQTDDLGRVIMVNSSGMEVPYDEKGELTGPTVTYKPVTAQSLFQVILFNYMSATTGRDAFSVMRIGTIIEMANVNTLFEISEADIEMIKRVMRSQMESPNGNKLAAFVIVDLAKRLKWEGD